MCAFRKFFSLLLVANVFLLNLFAAPPAGSSNLRSSGTAGASASSSSAADKKALQVRVSQLNSSDFPNIKAYVTVDDANGEVVSGIFNSSWFASVDDIYPVSVSTSPFSVSKEYISYNIIFSNSLVVGSGLLNVQTQAILNLVSNIAEKDKISVYTMGDTAIPVCEDISKNNFDFSVISTLESTENQSRVYDSIADCIQKISKKSDERKVLIVISDERDYTSRLSAQQFQNILDTANIPIYSIGVRRPSDSSQIKLEDMSKASGGRYYYTPMTRELSNTLLKISDYINSSYIVRLKVTGLNPDNLQHYIDISVDIRDSYGNSSHYFIASKEKRFSFKKLVNFIKKQNHKKNPNTEFAVDNSANLVSVKLITDNAGIDDKSFNASAWRGIERFYHNGLLKDKKYSFNLCKTQDEFQPILRNASDDADDLIIASGFFWTDAINAIAKDYPSQKYMLIDATSNNLPNVCNALFQEETGSYLVGVIAAKQAEAEGIPNPKFGFIGGVPSGTITRFEVGFIQGVRSVLPQAEIVDFYANSFSAPELGKIQAKNFFDQGVYCIFAAAGATGSGAIAQAKEYRLKGRRVWMIGVDCDQYEDGIYNDKGESAVLTSMLKNVDNAVYQVLTELQNGKFIPGVREFDLAADCVSYSISNEGLLAKDAIEAAENARADIIAGKIRVERTYRDALKRGLVPSGLRALDD